MKPPKNQVIFRTYPTEKSRLVFQMGSGSPETAVEAARLVANDVSAIDLNCGCPKHFSTSGGMGSALLSDVDRLVSILNALVTEIGKPFGIGISCKIRVLPSVEETETMVRRICQTGIIGTGLQRVLGHKLICRSDDSSTDCSDAATRNRLERQAGKAGGSL